MDFQSIEVGFLEYLEQLNESNGGTGKAYDVDSGELSIFIYANEFKKYLRDNNLADSSIFTKNISEIMTMDVQNGQLVDNSGVDNLFVDALNSVLTNDNFISAYDSNNNGGLDQKEILSFLSASENNSGEITFDSLSETIQKTNNKTITVQYGQQKSKEVSDLLENIYANDSAKKLLDLNGDGIISEAEKATFKKYIQGDNGELTAEDLEKVLEEIENGTYKYEPTEKTKDTKKTTETQENNKYSTSSAGSSGGGGSVSGGNYSVGTGTGSSSSTKQNYQTKGATETSEGIAKEISEIEKQIAEKNSQIEDKNTQKAELYKDNEIYQQLTADLNTVTTNVDNNKTNISQFEAELHSVDTEISSKQAELDSIQDPEIFTEYQDEINQKREALQNEIEELETKKQDIQGKLDQEKSDLSANETEKSRLEGEIRQFEEENPNEEVNKINEEIKTIETDIKSLENKKAEKQKELDKQREEEKSDAKVYGEAKAYRETNEFVKYMMDLATSPEIKQKFEAAYKGKGAYCAIFTSNIVEELYAEVIKRTGGAGMVNNGGDQNGGSQSVTGDQIAMHATAWGKKIQAALEKAGINQQATTVIRKNDGTYTLKDANGNEISPKDAVRQGLIRPGMIFEYEVNGNYHTGFIESINEDLTWNTIEGNTNGGEVGSHVRDASYQSLTSVTDPTLKVLYWLVQAGIITKDEANKRCHINA